MSTRVFLSWSGDSRPIAEALRDWLPEVLHSLDPWMSEEDIGKGERSFSAIEGSLGGAQYGLVCVTAGNQRSPWLNYEAGALARDVSLRCVSPFLVDMDVSQLQGPLANFQATKAAKEDVARLLQTLNQLSGTESAVTRERVTSSLDKWWDDLEEKLEPIRQALAMPTNGERPRRDVEGMVEDILVATKAMQRALDSLSLVDQTAERAAAQAPPALADSSGASRTIVRSSTGTGLGDRQDLPAFRERSRAAQEIWLSGVSLANITGNEFGALLAHVRDGKGLRALVLDPHDPQLVEIAARSLYGIGSPAELVEDVETTLSRLGQLQDESVAENQVEVEVASMLSAFAMTIFDPLPPGVGDAVVEIYPYRITSARRPHFRIRREHDGWFDFFVNQFEQMWQASRPIGITTKPALEHRDR